MEESPSDGLAPPPAGVQGLAGAGQVLVSEEYL